MTNQVLDILTVGLALDGSSAGLISILDLLIWLSHFNITVFINKFSIQEVLNYCIRYEYPTERVCYFGKPANTAFTPNCANTKYLDDSPASLHAKYIGAITTFCGVENLNTLFSLNGPRYSIKYINPNTGKYQIYRTVWNHNCIGAIYNYTIYNPKYKLPGVETIEQVKIIIPVATHPDVIETAMQQLKKLDQYQKICIVLEVNAASVNLLPLMQQLNIKVNLLIDPQSTMLESHLRVNNVEMYQTLSCSTHPKVYTTSLQAIKCDDMEYNYARYNKLPQIVDITVNFDHGAHFPVTKVVDLLARFPNTNLRIDIVGSGGSFSDMSDEDIILWQTTVMPSVISTKFIFPQNDEYIMVNFLS